MQGAAITKLIQEHEYYRTAIIPGGMYRGTASDTVTFGVGATFVTSTATAAPAVYHIVKSVFEDFELFKNLHPALKILNKTEMVSVGLSAPLHDGAVKYYKEVGLLK